MKLKLVLAVLTLALAFSSCQKCVVCKPYYYTNGVVGAYDSRSYLGGGTQTMKLCDKADIKAYETGKNFLDENNDTITFVCQ
jgi:hypothetical protein